MSLSEILASFFALAVPVLLNLLISIDWFNRGWREYLALRWLQKKKKEEVP